MKKKFFSKLLMVALVATVGVFSSCKDYDDDIADVRNNLSQTATELRTDYTNKINAVNTKIETLQTSYDKLSKALDESNAQLQTLINTKFDAAVKAAEAYSDANLVKAKDAAAAAEAAAKAYAETQAAAAQSAAIAAAKEQVAAAKAELEAALAKANELIATQGQSIANLIEADKTLDLAIKAAQSRADEAYALADKANTLAETNKTNIDKAAADIAALQKSLSALESKAADKADVAKLQSELAALQKQVGETVVNLADYKESIANITSELAKLKSDLEQQVSFLGENLAGVKKTAETNAASIESILTQLQELAKANELAQQKLAKDIEALDAKTSSALEKAIEGVKAEIGAANILIGKNTEAIASLTQTVQSNKDAQDKINEAIKGDVAQNAKDIVAKGKEIEALQKLIPELQSTLEKYADKVAGAAAQTGKDAAAAAEATAKQFALDAIAAQAELDEKAWNKAIDIAVKTLVETYELATLKETLQAYADHAASTAQNAAETNAAVAAQKISDKALETAMTYTDKLAQTLQDNYTQTVDMQKQIEAAKNAAIAQAYKEVLNKLLDGTDWASLIEQDKDYLTGVVPPSILSLIKGYVDEIGLSPEKIQDQIDTSIESFIEAAMTKSEPAEMGKPAVEAGIIMAAIEAAAKEAAENLKKVNDALDARLDKIEAFLTTTSGKETLDATIQYWIADLAKQADLDDVVAQLKGEKDGDLKKIIDNLKKADADNAADVDKIMASINKVTGMFAALLPAAEGDIDTDLAAYEAVMQALADRIFAMADVVDNLDDKVMEAVNKNLGPQIQTMITGINLYANQHMADLDERYKLAYWNGDEYEYPAGFENFDHELTFVYTVEQGIFSDLKGTVKQAEWNYPEGLLTQLKGLQNTRPTHYADDLDYDYEGVSFGALEGNTGADFVDGRYRSYEDSILVRVSPTNADLTKAELALLNSKGEDIIADELIQVVEVKKYEREAPITRFYAAGTRADAKETGLWVIKFKLNDDQVGEKWAKYSQYKGSDIVYAVAVKNTDFSTEETEDVDRYVVSEYDLSLATEAAKHSNDFKANGVSISKIHNRYIQAEQAKNGYTSWTDDPVFAMNRPNFRYELTWKDLCDDDIPAPEEQGEGDVDPIKNVWYEYCWDCCYAPDGTPNPDCYEIVYDENQKPSNGAFKGRNEIGYTSIIFNGATDGYEDEPYACGINTVDRYMHTFDKTSGQRDMDNGVDNRHKYAPLPITFSADQAPEGEDGEWARIDIEFPSFNQCGERTPIRGFFVTMDQHFAIESGNSEMNAWPFYITKNIAKFPYGNGKKKTTEQAILDVAEQGITLQKGNKGTIWIKDARNLNDGDVIGFRVHAVNLDGTFTDPDGRAFYVEVGNHNIHHNLSFHITATNFETGDSAVQDKVDGKNPIAQYNIDAAAENNIPFFNRDAYPPSFKDAEVYRVVLSWRDGNPAIRGYAENSVNAYWPVAGTGKNVANDYPKYNNKAVVLDKDGKVPDMDKYNYDVETFFSFKYSNDVVKENSEIDDAYWFEFDGKDAKTNPHIGPNENTNSVMAFINPNVVDRLIDGETYKVTMTIQRFDAQTTWITTNTIDIDITKQMPTESGLTVKTGQTEELANGVWTFYVRPLYDQDTYIANNGNGGQQGGNGTTGGNDNEVEDPSGRVDVTYQADPWKITWNTFAPEFETDYDADGKAITQNQHQYRWAADTRPWTLDEIFNGIIENGEVSKDFFFEFKGAGNFLAAHNQIGDVTAKDAWSTEALYDDMYKDADGTAVYNPNPAPVVSVQGDPTHQVIGYRMPYVHYSHINDGQFKVWAGKVYRRISANLKDDKFLTPKDEKSGNEGFATPILNRDYKVAATQIKTTDNKDLVATYKCALGNFFAPKSEAQGTELTCKYNERKALDIFGTTAAMVKKGKYDKMYPIGKSYVDTKFQATWSDATKVADLVAAKYLWIDYSSLEIILPANAPYTLSEWFDYYFAETANAEPEDAIDPADPENNSKIKFFIVKSNRTGLFSALTKEYPTIKVKYNVHDIWHHDPATVTIQGIKINKPENPASRQTR